MVVCLQAGHTVATEGMCLRAVLRTQNRQGRGLPNTSQGVPTRHNGPLPRTIAAAECSGFSPQQCLPLEVLQGQNGSRGLGWQGLALGCLSCSNACLSQPLFLFLFPFLLQFPFQDPPLLGGQFSTGLQHLKVNDRLSSQAWMGPLDSTLPANPFYPQFTRGFRDSHIWESSAQVPDAPNRCQLH